MPIYMDRHYVEGATRKAIEAAHRMDLDLQDEFDVQMKTYWFDEERSTAFCLAEAANGEALRRLHKASHGLVPNEIMEVDPLVVEAFLGRIEDPVPASPGDEKQGEGQIEPAFRSLMFTDLKDSTQLAVRLGDDRAMHLLRVHNALTRGTLNAHNGREVKTTGDGFLLSFIKAADAVNCAIAIQKAFTQYNEENPQEKLLVRIGIAAGEPIEERGDLYGAAVNLASRLCSEAKAGGILAAEIILKEIGDQKGSWHIVPGGEMSLKGFDQPVEVYEITWH